MSPATLVSGNRFLRSALSESSRFQSTPEAPTWLQATSDERRLLVDRVPLESLGEWRFDPDSGDLAHKSGKFFRVRGVRVHADLGAVHDWDQPIIDQPEIGILGIIVREFAGQLYFLMQAKMEPGNPRGVQLTLTVQATRSNYTQVHQGSRPAYIDYFLDPGLARVLVDQLQYEQGSAFLRKRNRNIIVEVSEDIPILEGFRWFTLAQIKKLLSIPNLVSMETRTVISCIPLSPGGLHAEGPLTADLEPFPAAVLASLNAPSSSCSDDEVLSWVTTLKCQHQLYVEPIGLKTIRGWNLGDEIGHEDDRFFRILGVDVESDSREVLSWNQPLIGATEQGLIAFVTAEIDGVLHFLAQGRADPGGADNIMVGPTVQCALGYERRTGEASTLLFQDLVEYPASGQVQYSCVQSEEGGRFYRVENEYRVVQVDSVSNLGPLPDNFTWMTGRQLQELLRFGLVNIEARSLLSCLSFT